MRALILMRRTTLLFLLGALLLHGAPARGADAVETDAAILTARGSGDLPKEVTVEVRPADENPEYALLVPVIERRLLAHNLVSAPGGTYVLRFSYRLTSIPESEREDANFSIVGRAGTSSRPQMQMQLRLRNEEKGSRGTDLLMTFEFYRPGSPPLWHATVLIPDTGLDRNAVLSRVTELSIDLLGKSGVHKISLE